MIKEILKVLPGGDCGGYGGCGFETCEACAEAIASGGAVNLCSACSQDDADKIAEALGRETEQVIDEVAFVRCSGTSAGQSRNAGADSCAEFVKLGFNENECKFGCVGLGSCARVCDAGAISIVDGRVVVDRAKCNGCKACQNVCPQNLVQMVPPDASTFIPCASQLGEVNTRKICGYGCIGCGECADTCPEKAITMVNNCAVIDYDKCVGCIVCSVKCKKKIIKDEAHDLIKLKETVAFVKCNGGKKVNDKFKALGLEDCAHAAKLDAGLMNICNEGCTGLGNCTKVCRYDAIHIVNGTAVVDFEKCVGCLDCVHACPKNLIVEVPYVGSKLVACSSKAPIDDRYDLCYSGCIDCTDCVHNCPNWAIEIVDSHAIVNGNICENCDVCTYMCSRNVIKRMDVPEYNYLQKKALKMKEVR